jgi:hypothetical protein
MVACGRRKATDCFAVNRVKLADMWCTPKCLGRALRSEGKVVYICLYQGRGRRSGSILGPDTMVRGTSKSVGWW